MITLLIGHRGTGKTSYLKSLKIKYPHYRLFDLDQEIEQRTDKSIRDIFAQEGESAFRCYEQNILRQLFDELSCLHRNDREQEVVIALGAGFVWQDSLVPSCFSHFVRILWLKRRTDQDGKIFLDRPRLEFHLPPLEEFLHRYKKREMNYAHWATEVIERREGSEEKWQLVDDLYWEKSSLFVGGLLTVLPWPFHTQHTIEQFWERRKNWQGIKFELRDDLLTEKQINWFLSNVPSHQLLLSRRFHKNRLEKNAENSLGHFTENFLKSGLERDWPLELDDLGFSSDSFFPTILSLHERKDEMISSCFERLEERANRYKNHYMNSKNNSSLFKSDLYCSYPLHSQTYPHLKLSIQIENWQELMAGHTWWEKDKSGRSFLPRSTDGRWRWYRQLFGKKMKLGFWQEGLNFVLDQPSLAEWLETPNKWNQFAGVLGYPVHHSRTPVEHGDFFLSQQMPVLSIPLKDEEWSEEVIGFLYHLGLRAAAVTSPLKQKIGGRNTMVWDDSKGWITHNTDLDGLRALLGPELASEKIAIWGGKGVLVSLRELMPHARFFSARSGELKLAFSMENSEHSQPSLERNKNFLFENFSPEIVVWAVGSGRRHEMVWPPLEWRPRWVIDLNYGDDSPGREYALRVGDKCQYRSGLKMFWVQAEKQREFWSKYFSPNDWA